MCTMIFALLLTAGLLGAAVLVLMTRRGQAIQRTKSIEEAARRAVEARLQQRDHEPRA
jgi:hypothetical protein